MTSNECSPSRPSLSFIIPHSLSFCSLFTSSPYRTVSVVPPWPENCNAPGMKQWFFFCSLLLLLASCAGRPEREVRKETRGQRKAPAVLTAKSAVSSNDFTLELLDNKTFTYYGKFVGVKNTDLYAGTYVWKRDSLLFAFHNNYKPEELTGRAVVDTVNKRLVMLATTPQKNRVMNIIK